MNAKMKECFTTHALLHSLTGLGVGILLVHFVPAANSLILGVGVVVVGAALDYFRK